MRIRFWGVRGSVAAPGPRTVRYGGNTSCVEVTLSDGSCLVFDGGTGLRRLGLDCARTPRKGPFHLFFSHGHWDHIQGFPFFAPIYDKRARLRIYSFEKGSDQALFHVLDQMDGAHFPVTRRDLPSRIEVVAVPEDVLQVGAARIRRIATNHPGGGLGFRIDAHGRSLVYMTDNELDAPGRGTPWDAFVAFCRGADLLVADAQYLPDDMPAKRGWGHSTVGEAVRLGAEAGVKHLVLFHHDPERSDEELDAVGRRAAAVLSRLSPGAGLSVAREGLVLDAGGPGAARARAGGAVRSRTGPSGRAKRTRPAR